MSRSYLKLGDEQSTMKKGDTMKIIQQNEVEIKKEQAFIEVVPAKLAKTILLRFEKLNEDLYKNTVSSTDHFESNLNMINKKGRRI